MSFAAGRSVNRIEKNEFLNQRCVLAPDLESILRSWTRKILFRQHRPIACVFEFHSLTAVTFSTASTVMTDKTHSEHNRSAFGGIATKRACDRAC
jgi:hypothetical protein